MKSYHLLIPVMLVSSSVMAATNQASANFTLTNQGDPSLESCYVKDVTKGMKGQPVSVGQSNVQQFTIIYPPSSKGCTGANYDEHIDEIHVYCGKNQLMACGFKLHAYTCVSKTPQVQFGADVIAQPLGPNTCAIPNPVYSNQHGTGTFNMVVTKNPNYKP